MLTILHTGQTGVERGADRAARAFGVRIAGVCTRERRDEMGPLPPALAADLTPAQSSGVRNVWAPTLELADFLVILLPDRSEPLSQAGVGVLRSLARARQVPHVLVDPTSDLEQVGREVKTARAGRADFAVMIFGPRQTRWQAGESIGRAFMTALIPYLVAEPRRVLVVDDHVETAQLTCDLVKMLGHDCVAASTATDALAKVTVLKPDVGLFDIQLPDLDGYQLATRIRTVQSEPLFLAAVTGCPDAQGAQRAHAAGFDHHVVKPLGVDLIRGIFDLAAARLPVRDQASDVRVG